MTFNDWAISVLTSAALQAPATKTNIATLRGWSSQEKTGLHPAPATFDWSQWSNPLNTTEPWPNAQDSGAQPGPHDVKIYANLTDGAAATVATIVNEPYYPAIAANLRHSLPARFWASDARSQLDTWGTGAGWLDLVPLQGDSPMEEIINRIFAIVGNPANLSPSFAKTYAPYVGQIWKRLDAIDQSLAALRAAGTGVATQAELDKAVADLRVAIGGITASLPPAQAQQLSEAHDAIARIEDAFKKA